MESILVADPNSSDKTDSVIVSREQGQQSLDTLIRGYTDDYDDNTSSTKMLRIANESQIQQAIEQLRIAEVGKRREAGLLQLKKSLLDALENRSKNKQDLHETRYLTTMLEQVNEAADSLLKGNGTNLANNKNNNKGEDTLVTITPVQSDLLKKEEEHEEPQKQNPLKPDQTTFVACGIAESVNPSS